MLGDPGCRLGLAPVALGMKGGFQSFVGQVGMQWYL